MIASGVVTLAGIGLLTNETAAGERHAAEATTQRIEDKALLQTGTEPDQQQVGPPSTDISLKRGALLGIEETVVRADQLQARVLRAELFHETIKLGLPRTDHIDAFAALLGFTQHRIGNRGDSNRAFSFLNFASIGSFIRQPPPSQKYASDGGGWRMKLPIEAKLRKEKARLESSSAGE